MGGVKLSEVKKGFFQARVDVSHYYGFEEDSEKVLLVFREPTEAEFNDFGLKSQTDNKEATMQKLSELWKDCLIDWNVLKDDEKGKITKKEMIEILTSSSAATYYLIKEWQKQLPLARRSLKDSDKSQESILPPEADV